MSGRVAGKVAVVVGGGQMKGQTVGNGRATAIVLGREGAKVVVADRDLASARETAETIAAEGGTAIAVEVDATSEASVRDMIAAAEQTYGALHILHNNVGASWGAGDASPMDATEETFDRIMALNFKSAWFAARHAIPLFRAAGGGSIVNISSVAARRAHGAFGYKTSKTALIALTEQLASQHAHENVRVNAILPGAIDTPMAIEPRVAKGADRDTLMTNRHAGVPLGGRMGTGWDIAYAALFLHSDEARFITGISLLVDGGESVADHLKR